ncbi:MAG: hypothetical protein K8T90_10200 [Planctomycetes bacterium]|nr:hypothetical protein [Planctomycetota bacterium]
MRHTPEKPPMRVGVVVATAVVVFLASWLGLAAIEAKESEDARIRARVREFTDPSAGSVRRELVVRELSDCDATAAARVVREALASDARRPAAAELAARLRLPGVFDAAKKWGDGPAAAQIAALAIAAPEPDAAHWLVERWRTADAASDRFRVADETMRTARASPAVVAGVGAALGDPEREAAALAILREQMAVDDPCPSALRERWPAAWARYAFEARTFPRDGDDLLSFPGWLLGSARRVGRNLRVAPSAFVELGALPPIAQVEAGVLHLRVAAGAGSGAFVSLRTAGASQDLRMSCDGNVWFLIEGPPRDGARVEVPFRADAWADVEVRVSAPAPADRPSVRDVRISVDGAELRPSGGFWRLASPPQSLVIGAARGDAATCVGGVAWARAR